MLSRQAGDAFWYHAGQCFVKVDRFAVLENQQSTLVGMVFGPRRPVFREGRRPKRDFEDPPPGGSLFGHFLQNILKSVFLC